jgi:hypothetical protein
MDSFNFDCTDESVACKIASLREVESVETSKDFGVDSETRVNFSKADLIASCLYEKQ